METMSRSTNTQAIMMAKKAMKMAHLLFHLLKKASSTTTNLLLKLTNNLASKAIDSLLLALSHHNHKHHHHPHVGFLSGRNDAVRSFPALKEYEFSCSNSPAFTLIPLGLKKCKIRRHRVDEAAVAAAVQRVFDMLNSDATEGAAGSAAATPMINLPGFGKSPAVAVRQLRVTDSPFPAKENEEESKQVSKAADEFIRKFYRDLKREKSMTAFESPYRHN